MRPPYQRTDNGDQCCKDKYKVLTIGVVMAILQQWCGINVIFNYAQEIFMAAGYGCLLYTSK